MVKLLHFCYVSSSTLEQSGGAKREVIADFSRKSEFTPKVTAETGCRFDKFIQQKNDFSCFNAVVFDFLLHFKGQRLNKRTLILMIPAKWIFSPEDNHVTTLVSMNISSISSLVV